ncbi:putative reverse transcriptase domain-containing protein [Tanacetum coccineum]|uniref:Reverse transcriptase domain-containing protein n=1 Tax=Tanacetum coccineum TaxID=301880 RepID=A0ABQ5CZE7_9ASTR
MEKDCRVRLQGACIDFLQNVTCFGCGEKGHFKDKCPKAMGNQHMMELWESLSGGFEIHSRIQIVLGRGDKQDEAPNSEGEICNALVFLSSPRDRMTLRVIVDASKQGFGCAVQMLRGQGTSVCSLRCLRSERHVMVAWYEERHCCAVSRFLLVLRFKAGHQKPSRLLQQPEILSGIMGNLSGSVGFENRHESRLPPSELTVRVERTIQTLEDMLFELMCLGFWWQLNLDPLMIWTVSWRSQLIDQKLCKKHRKIVQIREILKTASSCQKSYADKSRKPFEFTSWRQVLLKSCVTDTFHVSNLKKCLAKPDVQVPLDEIEIDENLRFVEEPIEIVERDVKKLKSVENSMVKVRWKSRQGAEYTWEREDKFRKKYPNLFSKPVPSSGVAT